MKQHLAHLLTISVALSTVLAPYPGRNAVFVPQTPTPNLKFTFAPNPVPAGSCSGSATSWSVGVTIQETGGATLTVSGYEVAFFDANDGNFISSHSFTASDFAQAFTGCTAGDIQIPANGSVCGTLCLSVPGHSTARAQLAIFGGRFVACDSVVLAQAPGQQGADLSISVLASSAAVAPGAIVLFTIRVVNSGPDVATGVQIASATPPAMTFRLARASQGTVIAPASGGSGPIECVVGALGPGAQATVWVLLNLNPSGTDTPSQVMTATVSSQTFDPTPDENSSSAAVGIDTTHLAGARADLSVSSSLSPAIPAAGTRATYTIVVTNSGPASPEGRALISFLPPGTTFAAATTSKPDVGLATPPVGGDGALVVDLPAIAPGDSRSVAITVNVVSGPGSNLSSVSELFDGAIPTNPLPACPVAPGCSGCSSPAPPPLSSADGNPNANISNDQTPVLAGQAVLLGWAQPASSPAQLTPAPLDLRVDKQAHTLLSRRYEPSATTTGCTLVLYNIYKSDAPNVQIVLDNLWAIVPPDLMQSTLAAAPSGSFYVVTSLWNCNGIPIQSGASNEAASSGAGSTPAILGVLAAGKNLQVMGKGFDLGAVILENGVEKPTSQDNQNSDSLLTGRKVYKKLNPGQIVILRVRNSDGSLSNEYTFSKPA